MPDDARDEAIPHADAADAAVVIRLIRSGGVAGVRRAWLVVSPERTAWEPVIESCPWDAAPSGEGEDRYVWRVEVRSPLPEREAIVPESSLDGPWRELVDRVRDEGEPVRPPGPGR